MHHTELVKNRWKFHSCANFFQLISSASHHFTSRKCERERSKIYVRKKLPRARQKPLRIPVRDTKATRCFGLIPYHREHSSSDEYSHLGSVKKQRFRWTPSWITTALKAGIVVKHRVLVIFKGTSLQSNTTDVNASETSSMNWSRRLYMTYSLSCLFPFSLN